jgi:hypothetical protein
MTHTPNPGFPSSEMTLQRPPAPTSVKVARALVFVQAFLAGLLGLLILVVGTEVLGVTGGESGRLVIVVAAVVFVLTGLWVWAGIAVGRLKNGARWTVVSLSALGCLVELVKLGHTPGRSIIGILLSGAVIYLLAFDASARTAFDASPGSSGYGMPLQRQVPYAPSPTTMVPQDPGSIQPPPLGSS